MYEQGYMDIEEGLYIEGELLHMIFYNEQEHFAIAKIEITDHTEKYDEDTIVIKGHFPRLQEGTSYRFLAHLNNTHLTEHSIKLVPMKLSCPILKKVLLLIYQVIYFME